MGLQRAQVDGAEVRQLASGNLKLQPSTSLATTSELRRGSCVNYLMFSGLRCCEGDRVTPAADGRTNTEVTFLPWWVRFTLE